MVALFHGKHRFKLKFSFIYTYCIDILNTPIGVGTL